LRRILLTLVAGLLASTALTGCHGGVHAQAVMTGLEFPAAFTVGPDNDTIWYAERLTGEIRSRKLSTGEDTLVWTVPNLLTNGERGLLGLALHPNYPATPLLYAFATRELLGVPRNQVLKITLSGGVGVSQISILGDHGIANNHNGGRILFGPGGNLFIATGDHQTPANSQTIDGNNNLGGKILRVTSDGAVPAGNPFAGSAVWAFGIRNSFGFAFDPMTNGLWVTDNGPGCNDEVDRIVKGGNFSWGPSQTCMIPPAPPQNTNQDGPAPQLQPNVNYEDANGITGTAFCSDCGLGSAFEGRLLHSFVNDGILHKLTLDAARTSIVGNEVVYDHPSGILSIETRAGQPIYFSDSESIYRLKV
jgi:glucose/arabinose dehydrogenase